MQPLLTTVAAQAARDSGFVQRRSKLTSPRFVQCSALGWLGQPDPSLSVVAQGGALYQRFTARRRLPQAENRSAARRYNGGVAAMPSHDRQSLNRRMR
jgi:hypothetical protein